MISLARNDGIQRSPVFNAVSAGLVLVSVAWMLFLVATPEGPLEMMIPWARTVNKLQALLGAACVTLIWLRHGWAFYVYVGLIMFGVLVGLVQRLPFPYLAIGPAFLGLYLWGLHSGGTESMWRQLFGPPGGSRQHMAYGAAAAMPPARPNNAVPPRPPAPPSAPSAAPQPPMPAAAARPASPVPPAPRPAGGDPLDTLKRLGALRDSGAITEAEFAAKKAELLQRL
jgi:hypothetical protein